MIVVGQIVLLTIVRRIVRLSVITGNQSKQELIVFVKIAKYKGFRVCRTPYLV